MVAFGTILAVAAIALLIWTIIRGRVGLGATGQIGGTLFYSAPKWMQDYLGTIQFTATATQAGYFQAQMEPLLTGGIPAGQLFGISDRHSSRPELSFMHPFNYIRVYRGDLR